MEQVISLIFNLIGLYLAVGLLFAVAFLARGIQRVDGDSRGARWSFKLIILPGVCVFWPMLLVKWLKTKKTT